MVAAFASENRLARIIGNRTAGNVLGAMNFSLGYGYWLRVSTFGWQTSKGNWLEGAGVLPDEVLEVDAGFLMNGLDEQMDKAIQFLGGRSASKEGHSDIPETTRSVIVT